MKLLLINLRNKFVCNMFHSINIAIFGFIKKVKSLFLYVYDFKVIFISILYIIFNTLGLTYLRNINLEHTMRLTCSVFASLLLFLIAHTVMRNIVRNNMLNSKPCNSCSIFVNILRTALFAFLIGSFAISRLLLFL